ncbi:MAG TPA: sarcosine oxidase subunit delta [Gemmataceae bacterium]|jgi:sarcosine oxidase delta subunit|nr:sarcosine oxidase subunit delta [Gemmataceae bacterium]
MSFQLTCPNCGPRDVSEFRYGGQVAAKAKNLPEVQQERWLHRFGCGCWLLARRDVRTNAVLHVELLQVITETPELPGDAS